MSLASPPPSFVNLGELDVLVGHWTDAAARTGCTVVLLPTGTTASGEVRGGSPATREFQLLTPTAAVQHIDAVVLSGGSAFGLAASDGVMRWLEEHERGFPTAGGVVPIVVGLSLFDLTVGSVDVRPTAENGYDAAAQATHRAAGGPVGAGAGATISKWLGAERRLPGGFGVAVVRAEGVTVAALIAVNAWGSIDDGTTRRAIAAGSQREWPAPPSETFGAETNTTIGVVVTNAALTKPECFRVAQAAHGGMDRALFPAHAQPDGDAIVAAATGQVPAVLATVEMLAGVATEQAIRSSTNESFGP